MKCFLVACAVIASISSHSFLSAQSRTRQALQEFTFENYECKLSIDSIVGSLDKPSNEHLSVSCNGKSVLEFQMVDAGFGSLQIAPKDGLIFVDWERGTGIDFTVFHLTSGSGISSKKIFEAWNEFGADVLPLSEELLVHHGKRFVDGMHEIFPKWTEKYVRSGDSYKLVQVYKWDDKMRWKDTYCVLVPLVPSCPATLETAKHPWDKY